MLTPLHYPIYLVLAAFNANLTLRVELTMAFVCSAVIRALIEKIVVTPVPTGGKRMASQIDLHGALAGILGLSL